MENVPFEVSETGYGEFEVELRLYFDTTSGEKAQYRFHRLRLEAYGDEAQQAKQRAQNSIIAETCEIVEFNEPATEFFAKLTSEDQFAHMWKKRGGKGGGKGRGKVAQAEYDGAPPSANLPERSTEQVPWSREMERKVLDMLKDAQRELDVSIQQEIKKADDRRKKLAEMA